jgi:excisionase family DNA binding protein
MELLKLHEAAQLAGVSYPTLKQWIYKGVIRSVKTAGGHHRIPRSEIERLGGANRHKTKRKPVGLDAISGRNKLFGKITEMRYDGLLAQVSIEIGGQTITSISRAMPPVIWLERCFQLMETADRKFLDEWIANWNDLIEFEVYPVISSKEAAKKSLLGG